MNSEKMYMPNRDIWMNYYKNVVQGKNDSYITHMRNGGKKGTFMIPIENNVSSSRVNDKCQPMKIQLVSPSAQMVDMARETLQEEGVTIKKRKIKHKAIREGEGGKRNNVNKKTKERKKPFKKTDVFSK